MFCKEINKNQLLKNNLSFQARYLANTVDPYVTILLRAVRSDQKLQGYQITAYFNKQDGRVQIILANLAESESWRMCADAVLLSDHKMMVSALL